MDDKITKLNNIEGLRLLKLTKLDYSKNIINLLKNNPNCLPTLLEALEVTEEEFSDYLLDNKKIDITFYDQALSLLLLMNNKIKIK